MQRNKEALEERDLQDRIEELEEALETQNLILQQLTRPPLAMGTIVYVEDDTAQVIIGGQRYQVAYHPDLEGKLARGQLATINQQSLAIVSIQDQEKTGNITNVSEVLDDGRIKITVNGNPIILPAYEGTRPGDSVLVDTTGSVILENLGRINKTYALEEVPTLPWSRIGGLDDLIMTIKDVIETPFTHKELYEKYHKRTPKGVLLSGPPGCGKTLLAKAIAYNLAKSREERGGETKNGYFINIKGPEVLSKWVGQAEETIRMIFSSAREKSEQTGEPVIIFFDEAESIFKRRGSGISTDVYDSIVPQFLAEMDGLTSNYDVILVLATNRQDIIDPAVLRPGRIDRKLEVPRPSIEGAKAIYKIYLEGIPIAKSTEEEAKNAGMDTIDYLAHKAVEKLYSPQSIIGGIRYHDGSSTPITYKSVVSGALIESTVQRATDYAIKREIGQQGEQGLKVSDVVMAIEAEYRELKPLIKTMLMEEDIRAIAKDRSEDISDIIK